MRPFCWLAGLYDSQFPGHTTPVRFKDQYLSGNHLGLRLKRHSPKSGADALAKQRHECLPVVLILIANGTERKRAQARNFPTAIGRFYKQSFPLLTSNCIRDPGLLFRSQKWTVLHLGMFMDVPNLPKAGQVTQPGRGRCHIALLGGHRCYLPSGSDHPARLSDQKAPGAKFHDHLQEGLHPGGHVFRGSTLVDEFLVGELGTHQRISKPRRQKSCFVFFLRCPMTSS